jgi:hypothetical protein
VLNLAAMLRDGRDVVQQPLRLQTKGGSPSSPVELTVSLLAVEALRRLRAPHVASDAVRVDVGKLTLIKPLLGDRAVDELWLDLEWVDGVKVLETKRLRAADAQPRCGARVHPGRDSACFGDEPWGDAARRLPK